MVKVTSKRLEIMRHRHLSAKLPVSVWASDESDKHGRNQPSSLSGIKKANRTHSQNDVKGRKKISLTTKPELLGFDTNPSNSISSVAAL